MGSSYDSEVRTEMAKSQQTLGHSSHEAITADFEWSVLRFHHAFERYCLHVANVAGLGAVSFSELELLIVVCMQDQPLTAAQIARQMNQPVNNVHYGLGKLASSGLVRKTRESRGNGAKNFVYTGAEKGNVLIGQYAAIRHKVLTEQTRQIEKVDESMSMVTKFLNLLASVYDEAGRTAATQPAPPRSA